MFLFISNPTVGIHARQHMFFAMAKILFVFFPQSEKRKTDNRATNRIINKRDALVSIAETVLKNLSWHQQQSLDQNRYLQQLTLTVDNR